MNTPLVIFAVLITISIFVQVVALIVALSKGVGVKEHIINLVSVGLSQALLYSAGLWSLW